MAAPDFPEPELLDLDDEEKEKILDAILHLYRDRIEERTSLTRQHVEYDQMYRGQLDTPRSGPWPGSSNLHVQMPYWLVDSINTRLVSGIWGQVPLVSGKAEEDDDQDAFRSSTHLVDWHLQPKRMNARAMWSMVSRIRCIHGFGVGLISHARDEYAYRTLERTGAPSIRFNPDGTPQLDENDEPVVTFPQETRLRRAVRYDGPILHPIEWDDLVIPQEGFNLQPNCDSNPGGCDYVGLRQWQNLSLLWKRREGAYGYIAADDERSEREWWVKNAPSQDRSGDAITSDNQQRARTHDRYEGRQRSLSSRRTPLPRPNPEFETLVWFMPWELENEDGEKEEQECVFFACTRPRILLGAFRLSDIYWKNERPLLELHYQRVGTRFYSMGVMEIAKHLSAELDTIHNMRIDVGFATNMPFFFYRATTTLNPEKIQLKPLKGVPVDDINDVRFPQLQNVTSFYHQEEQLLYTLVERVMGVTDLFLGMSPTHGAAARHATGFVGTQQESLARTSEVLNGDADAAAFLFRTIYNLEMQYGPEERILRLQGHEGPLTQKLTRDQLWMRGEYDFRLGANAGMYSSMVRQQQGQALMALKGQSPLIAQDPGKMWEVENFYLHAIGIPNPEQFIGPKDAVAPASPKRPEEENGEMDQFVYGLNIPAPVHPNDNDPDHIQKHMAHLSDEGYNAMGRPNYQAHVNHIMSHQQQLQQKQQMQQMQALQAMQSQQGMQPPQTGQGPALGQERIEPQLQGVGSMGAMGDVGQSPGANGRSNGFAPPNLAGILGRR